MSFAEMNQQASLLVLSKTVIEIMSHLRTRIILKQFRIGPLHPAFTQQSRSGLPGAAESFEEKNGLGKFLLDPRDDELPGIFGHFIAGITAESIHSPPAPGQEDG